MPSTSATAANSISGPPEAFQQNCAYIRSGDDDHSLTQRGVACMPVCADDTFSHWPVAVLKSICLMLVQLNDVLSLGQHRVWKRMAVKWCEASTGQYVLDVCCGSGDLAFRLAEAVGPAGQVIIPVFFGQGTPCMLGMLSVRS